MVAVTAAHAPCEYPETSRKAIAILRPFGDAALTGPRV
jgi:hypothetical protein